MKWKTEKLHFNIIILYDVLDQKTYYQILQIISMSTQATEHGAGPEKLPYAKVTYQAVDLVCP
jgi:hypothetical protein